MLIKHWNWGYLLCTSPGNTSPLKTHTSSPVICPGGHNSVTEHNNFMKKILFNVTLGGHVDNGLEKGRLFLYVVWNSLSAFSTDTSCQLDVLWHDGDTLGVDGARVRNEYWGGYHRGYIIDNLNLSGYSERPPKVMSLYKISWNSDVPLQSYALGRKIKGKELWVICNGGITQ